MNRQEILKSARKLDTPALSDALDSLGVACCLLGVKHQSGQGTAAGWAYTVKYRPLTENDSKQFRSAANYIDEVPEDSIIVIDNDARTDCTSWGDILTKAALGRGIAGTVINGSVRDIGIIRSSSYHLASVGVTMVSGKNRVVAKGTGDPLDIGGIAVFPGDLIVMDECGVLAVPAKYAEEAVDRAMKVEATEAKIRSNVDRGARLDESRQSYNYAEPWRSQEPIL